jgi:hypothetical protein
MAEPSPSGAILGQSKSTATFTGGAAYTRAHPIADQTLRPKNSH